MRHWVVGTNPKTPLRASPSLNTETLSSYLWSQGGPPNGLMRPSLGPPLHQLFPLTPVQVVSSPAQALHLPQAFCSQQPPPPLHPYNQTALLLSLLFH